MAEGAEQQNGRSGAANRQFPLIVYRADDATEIGGATDPLISPTVEGQGENNSPGAAPDVSVANDEESTSKERQEQQKIQESMDFLSCFNYIFDNTTSTKLEKELDFKTLLKRKEGNSKDSLQKAFAKMLNDIDKYEEFLELFIARFETYNERIENKYLPTDDTKKENEKKQPQPIINEDQNTMRELDAPLHCAVRQLNKGFLEWLLKQPATEVNLRNKQNETALAILCQKYDCVSKWKARLEEIEKELKNANDTKKKELDDEKIELVALEKQLNENIAPLILKLIMMLLDKKADFNIYLNDRALPFDFLRKYYEETVLDEIIKKASAESSVAMTEISPKQVNASAEDKKKLEKRIVKFYKETKDMKVRVTVELLEIFIRFNHLEKFKQYWKDFKVTSDNVKKVITQLLHVAVELNYTTFVDHIVKKASDEIFTSNPPVEANFISERTSTNAVAALRPQGETFKQEKNETENSQVTCAGTSKGISTNVEGLCSENPSATEGAEPQTQSETSKLPLTDLHMESGTSKLEDIVPQKQSGTIESQDNPPVSQDTRVGTTAATRTSDEQPSGWCCLKCFQKKQNPSLPDGTNPQAQKLNSKDLVKAEENKMVHHNELKGLLNMVCLNGNIDLLNMFLEKMNDRLLLNESPLLINTLNEAYTMKQKKESIFLLECIKILINNHNRVDMYRVDLKGNTVLHLALSYGYDTIALLMLKKVHSLMWFRNHQNKTPIEYGTTEFWNTYLDSCISTNNDESELIFDVGFLKPRIKDESSDTSMFSFSKWLFCYKRVEEMNETHNSEYRFTRTVNDMTALRLVSQFKDRKEFLIHPVNSAFITMKWKSIIHLNILNLLLTLYTMIMVMAYTLTSCPTVGWEYDFAQPAAYGTGIIFVRELIQILLLRCSYFTLENIVDIINVAFIGIVLGCGCDRSGMCIAVPYLLPIAVVILSFQTIFLVGGFWNKLSIRFYMLKTVLISFIKSLFFFAPVFFAIFCSTYRTYIEPSGFSISNGTEPNSSQQNFNNSHSVWKAVKETLAIITGTIDINFNFARPLLFIACSFTVSIVIMKLTHDLALNAVPDILKESEFISLCEKVRLLKQYERAMARFHSIISGYLQRLCCDRFCPSSFFENYESIIYVNVNEKNKLAIKSKKKANSTKEAITALPLFSRCCLKCYLSMCSFQVVFYMSLDESYVDKAKTIVRRQCKNNSGLGTSELADTEQIDTVQYNTMALSKLGTSPYVPDSRDKQIEMLQEQVRNIIAMLTDIQQQLSGSHASEAELTASTSVDHSRAGVSKLRPAGRMRPARLFPPWVNVA